MPWYKISFTFNQIEKDRALLNLEKKFEKIYIDADGPSDMALFSDNEYHDNRINIYFTPGCSPACDYLIKEYKGVACEAPDVEHVTLVTGNDDAEDLLATH
jgi:hypothetical protein